MSPDGTTVTAASETRTVHTRPACPPVKCNHHNTHNAGGESELDFSATAGKTYYVELAGYQSTGGGRGSVRVYPKP